MNTYYGRNRRVYVTADEINDGGEGTVYNIEGDTSHVIKIYKPAYFRTSAERQNLKEKLEAMLTVPVNPRVNGELSVAWPTDILYDSQGVFRGFAMPAVRNKKSIIWACRREDRDKLFKNRYQWQISAAVAYNLASAVDNLHKNGILVGDMNATNLLVDSRAIITLIDADSFGLLNIGGRAYPCSAVGMDEFKAPEIQEKDLEKPGQGYTKETDCFALAIHIFNLLCNNCHPFGCPDRSSRRPSSRTNAVVHNIKYGRSPYVRRGFRRLPADAPDMKLLPRKIRNLFRRTFRYTVKSGVRRKHIEKRPTAAEWKEALWELYNTDMKKCRKNAYHMYPASYHKACPWCRIAKRKMKEEKNFLQSLQKQNVSAGKRRKRKHTTQTPAVRRRPVFLTAGAVLLNLLVLSTILLLVFQPVLLKKAADQLIWRNINVETLDREFTLPEVYEPVDEP